MLRSAYVICREALMKYARWFSISVFLSISLPAFAAAPEYRIIDRISVPDGGFDYATFDQEDHRILMSRTDFVTVLDPTTKSITQLSSTSGGHMALAIPGTNKILVTQGGPGIVRIVDASRDTVIADVKVGENPDAALYDPFSKYLYVMNHGSGDASIIDPETAHIVETIPIGGELEFGVSDGAGKIFVNVEDQAKIAVIDVATRSVSARYDMPGCDSPTGLGYDAPTKYLIASCDGIAKVLDADTGREVASVAIGDGPDAVIYDGAHRQLFIPCGGSGELDVISIADPAHITVTQRVPTQVGTRTGTLDPTTGLLYMLTAQTSPNSPAVGRRIRVPGTYEVLVVGQ
jgi:YVTN family beta-propeller protein